MPSHERSTTMRAAQKQPPDQRHAMKGGNLNDHILLAAPGFRFQGLPQKAGRPDRDPCTKHTHVEGGRGTAFVLNGKEVVILMGSRCHGGVEGSEGVVEGGRGSCFLEGLQMQRVCGKQQKQNGGVDCEPRGHRS